MIAILYKVFGISATRIERLASGVMNDNFRVESDRGPFVLRVYRTKSEPETRLERFMLQTLSTTGFPCPKPMTDANGSDVFLVDEKPAILYPMLEGVRPQHTTTELLEQIGRLQAQIHVAFFDKTPPVKKAGWDPDDVRHLLSEWRSRIEASEFPDAKHFLDDIQHNLERLSFPSDLPRGLTHQDIKPENVLVDGERVTGILDFDNCYQGALLHDLTTTIIWWCFENGKLSDDLVRAFRNGYESLRPLTSDEDRLLLTDGLRFRLLREMFVGPMTTLSNIPLATERARHFQTLYKNTFE